jgi:hypothetical protein
MERSSWTLIICTALGAAALVLALVPSSWPNPLAGGANGDSVKSVPVLEDAAKAVDAACREGDGDRFAQVTTASYRQGLERRLSAVDASLDSATLQAMAAAAEGYQGWFRRRLLATHVADAYAAVVVKRDQKDDGAQVLVFRWDGEQFLLDDVRHAPRVETEPAAKRFAVELLRLRERGMMSDR